MHGERRDYLHCHSNLTRPLYCEVDGANARGHSREAEEPKAAENPLTLKRPSPGHLIACQNTKQEREEERTVTDDGCDSMLYRNGTEGVKFTCTGVEHNAPDREYHCCYAKERVEEV